MQLHVKFTVLRGWSPLALEFLLLLISESVMSLFPAPLAAAVGTVAPAFLWIAPEEWTPQPQAAFRPQDHRTWNLISKHFQKAYFFYQQNHFF
jgi:hypothetical protein